MKSPRIYLASFMVLTSTIACLGSSSQFTESSLPTSTQTVHSPPISTYTPVPTATIQVSPTPYFPGLITFPNIKVEYYDIQGSTAEELIDEIFEKGPIAGFEQYLSVAAVEYDLWYTWPGKSLGNCELNKAETGYTLKIIAPRWEPNPETSPELIESWIKFMEEVKAHEEGHLDIIREYHKTLKDVIANSTCLAASDAAYKVEMDLMRAHEEYDKNSEPAEFP